MKRSGSAFLPTLGEETVPLEFWEQVEVEKLGQCLRHFAVDCVFDVGANRGHYADLLRTHVGYKGIIILYEPIPDAFAELSRRAASDPQWHVRQVALDRFPGRAEFNVMNNDKFSSLKSPSADDSSGCGA